MVDLFVCVLEMRIFRRTDDKDLALIFVGSKYKTPSPMARVSFSLKPLGNAKVIGNVTGPKTVAAC
jgi:hypothetical protein